MKMNVSLVSVTGAESLSMERSVPRLHEGIRLHLYVGVYSPHVSIRGLLPPSSLSSAIPYVFLMNLCRPMFLRHPVGFDGYLAGISLPICTLFSFVNIGACMLRIPLCLIEHVGILHISMFASSTQFVWFWCMFRQCKMCRRPDVHDL